MITVIRAKYGQSLGGFDGLNLSFRGFENHKARLKNTQQLYKSQPSIQRQDPRTFREGQLLLGLTRAELLTKSDEEARHEASRAQAKSFHQFSYPELFFAVTS